MLIATRTMLGKRPRQDMTDLTTRCIRSDSSSCPHCPRPLGSMFGALDLSDQSDQSANYARIVIGRLCVWDGKVHLLAQKADRGVTSTWPH